SDLLILPDDMIDLIARNTCSQQNCVVKFRAGNENEKENKEPGIQVMCILIETCPSTESLYTPGCDRQQLYYQQIVEAKTEETAFAFKVKIARKDYLVVIYKKITEDCEHTP